MADEGLVAEQIAYYRARAPEYEGPLYGTAELQALVDDVAARVPTGRDVLEIACGTGAWTRRLAPHANYYLALDAAPEMIDIARAGAPSAEFAQADVFSWTPPRRFDVVFFSAWLSHVPHSRFADFWHTVGDALRPDGTAIFLDQHVSVASIETWLSDEVVERTLEDGSRHRVVKCFFDPESLSRRLAEIGWDAEIERIGTEWVFGTARPATR